MFEMQVANRQQLKVTEMRHRNEQELFQQRLSNYSKHEVYFKTNNTIRALTYND